MKSDTETQKQRVTESRLPVFLCVSVVMLCFGGVDVAAEDIPVPSDVKTVSPPYESAIGKRAITMQGFSTTRSLAQLRAFYLNALPKDGWRPLPLPWLATRQQEVARARQTEAEEHAKLIERLKQEGAGEIHDESEEFAHLDPKGKVGKLKRVKEEIERMMREHPDPDKQESIEASLKKLDRAMEHFENLAAGHPESPEGVAAAQAGADDVTQLYAPDTVSDLQQMSERELYAVRGAERLLLDFGRQQDGQTLVVINRWREEATDGFMSVESGVPSTAPPAWPSANPCCAGESVPPALRKLPTTIPAYPNGRMISTSASPVGTGGRSSMAELYMTDDSASQVSVFYRTQLAYNGWTESSAANVEATRAQLAQLFGPQAAEVSSELLTFRNDQGVCMVAAVEHQRTTPAAPGKEAGIGPAASDQIPSTQGGSDAGDHAEHTVIIVTYSETPWLNRARHYNPAAGGTKP